MINAKRKSRPFRTRQACRTLPRVASVPLSSKGPLGSGVLTSFGLTRSLNRNAGRRSLGCNLRRQLWQPPARAVAEFFFEIPPAATGAEYASRNDTCARFQSASACAGGATSRGRTRCLNAAPVNARKPPCLLGKQAPQCNTATRRNGRNFEFSEVPTR